MESIRPTCTYGLVVDISDDANLLGVVGETVAASEENGCVQSDCASSADIVPVLATGRRRHYFVDVLQPHRRSLISVMIFALLTNREFSTPVRGVNTPPPTLVQHHPASSPDNSSPLPPIAHRGVVLS